MTKLRAWFSKRWPVLLAALALAIPLMIALRDVVRDAIVYPLARFFWIVRIVFLSIPPVFIWGYFLLIAVRVVLHSLRSAPRSVKGPGAESLQRRGRVGTWARRIRLTAQGDYSLWGLAHHLSDLAVDILASSEGIDPSESRRRLQAGEWDVPDEMREYFRVATRPVPVPRQGTFLLRLWRRLLGRRDRPHPLDVDLQTVVAFLESRVGIDKPDRKTR